MKRVILAAVLLVSTASVFAAGENSDRGKIDPQKKWKTEDAMSPTCTVSMEGSVTLIGVSVKVTCSASATTCKEAITQAAKCLEEAKQILMY
jgi:hypothetical protein